MTVTNFIPQNYIPYAQSEQYIPDQLISGALHRVTTQGALLIENAGALVRGTVLGVVTSSGQWKVCVETATDGSQVPQGILATVSVANNSTGATEVAIYMTGEFNFNSITFDSSWGTGTAAQNALNAAARPYNIFLRTVTSANPPSNE